MLSQEMKLANRLLEQNKAREAMDHYRRIISEDADNAQAYCNMGSALFQQGELSEAENYFKLSLSKDNNLKEAYFNLGCLYQDRGEFENALSVYKDAIKRQQDDAETFVRMGKCAIALNRIEDGLRFYEEAFRLRPNDLDYGAALVSSYIEASQPKKAEKVLRILLVSYPEEVHLHFTLALILKDLKQFDSALAHFNKVVLLDEENSEGFYHLADCCLNLNLIEQAESFFAKAYDLDHTFHEAVLRLAQLYENAGNSEAAVDAYCRWIEMIEKRIWQYDESLQDTFDNACRMLAAHFKEKGESDKGDAYLKKIQNPERNEVFPQEQKQTSDYRVSLSIDD